MAETKKNANTLEVDWIRELAGILDETGLTEIEIEKANIRVRVARGGAVAALAPAPVAPAAAPAPAPAPQAVNEPAPQPAARAAHPGAVPSPMVGTAYLAASPGADPFVKVGDAVAEGQTVLIVEAMKTMNPITAPKSGKVVDVLVQDAQAVEFGEPLMIIE